MPGPQGVTASDIDTIPYGSCSTWRAERALLREPRRHRIKDSILL